MAQIDFDIGFIKKIKSINPKTEIVLYTYSPVATEGSELYTQVTSPDSHSPKNWKIGSVRNGKNSI
jgi:hypothetical protein